MSATDSHLEQEIAQQSTILRTRAEPGMRAAWRAGLLLGHDDVEHIVIAARGSSDNAARFAQYLLGDQLQIEVALAAPSLYRRTDLAPRLTHAAVIGISQSGRSPDIVGVLAAASAQRRPTIAITNDARSPLAEHADVVIPLLAGQERSVAATKTYLASLHAIVQLVETLAPQQARREWLQQLPDLVHTVAHEMLQQRNRFEPLEDTPTITVTGRGLAFAAACESALKLRELSGIPAEAFSPPDLMHGPIAAITTTGASWLINPGDELHELTARTTTNVIVSTDTQTVDLATIPVRLPPAPPWVSAILAVLPAQAAAIHLAERRNVNLDMPHGLQKITLTH